MAGIAGGFRGSFGGDVAEVGGEGRRRTGHLESVRVTQVIMLRLMSTMIWSTFTMKWSSVCGGGGIKMGGKSGLSSS